MTDREIQQALDDIAELKKSVKGHLRLITPILLDRQFIGLSVVGAIFFGLFFSAIGVLVLQAGSFASVTASAKVFLAAVFLLFTGLAGIWKTRIISCNLAKQRASLTFRDLFRDSEYSALFALLYAGMFAVIVTGAITGTRTGDFWILLPLISLYYSFMIALFAIVFLTPEYFTMSAVSAVFGFASLVFMHSHQFFWLAAWSSSLMISFAVTIAVSTRKRER
jgi:hypothetical protein